MNHLTTREMFQIVDGTIANGERSELIAHLESCQRCSMEFMLQRSLSQAAKEAQLTQPSKGFTSRVVGTIAPQAKRSWVSRIVDNLGNIMAMGLVLSIVWYAVTMAPTSASPTQPSAFSKAFGVYVEYYAKARDAASREFVKLVGEPKKEQTAKTSDVATLTLISLLILVAIDRFVVRRVIRIRL